MAFKRIAGCLVALAVVVAAGGCGSGLL